MIRTIAADLGLNGRCALLLAVDVALFIAAIAWKVDALYGAVAVLAFAAGALWDREVCCDECGTSLEADRSV